MISIEEVDARIIEIFGKGAPIYHVGGTLRDQIMGKEPKDFDFTTSFSPDEIEEKIKSAGSKAYVVGKRFGTVGFTIKGNMIEITTFRTEKYEKDNRKPTVEFVNDISADLSRRDFTINSMAKRVGSTKIIDPFFGREDLKQKIIRCVGNPKHRFTEDPLRMLRAARFSSTLNMDIEYDIWRTVSKTKRKLRHISKERISSELFKILMGDNVGYALDFLMMTNLMQYIIPELTIQKDYDQNSKFHRMYLWDHTVSMIYHLEKDPILRLAGLLHDIGKPFVRENKKDRSTYVEHDLIGAEMALWICKRLKMSNEIQDRVFDLILNHLRDDSPLKWADNQSKINYMKEEDKDDKDF